MYAVISTGGKQYRVKEGSVLRVEKLDAADGDKVEFDKVLLVGEGRDAEGFLEGAEEVAFGAFGHGGQVLGGEGEDDGLRDARLDHHIGELLIHMQDAVHPLQDEHDAASLFGRGPG